MKRKVTLIIVLFERSECRMEELRTIVTETFLYDPNQGSQSIAQHGE